MFYIIIIFLVLCIVFYGIDVIDITWCWIPPQDRGDVYGVIRKIINTIIYQYNFRYNHDKYWSNAFQSAFARDYDYNSNRCWALPEHNCTGGGGIYILPCGHFYCRDCVYNHYYHDGLKWWSSYTHNPFAQTTKYLGGFSCPQQECRQKYSCYIIADAFFRSELFHWYGFRSLANSRFMQRNKDLLIAGYMREEEDYNGMMIPTVINGCINKTYTDFYMNP